MRHFSGRPVLALAVVAAALSFSACDSVEQGPALEQTSAAAPAPSVKGLAPLEPSTPATTNSLGPGRDGYTIGSLDIAGPFRVKTYSSGAWALTANGESAELYSDYIFSWRVDTEWPFDNNPSLSDPWPETYSGWWYGTGTGFDEESYYIQGTAEHRTTGQTISTPLYIIEVAGDGAPGQCVQNYLGYYVYPCEGSTVVYPGQGGGTYPPCEDPSKRQTCACYTYASRNPGQCNSGQPGYGY